LQDVSTVLLVAIITTFAIPIFGRSAEQGMTFFLSLILWAALMYAVAGMAAAAQAGTVVRMSAFGGGPNVFVRIMCMGIFAAFCSFARAKQLRWLLPVPLLLICALFSGSRGGLVAFVVTFSLFMLFVSWKKYIGNYTIVVVAVIPGIMYCAVAYIQPLNEFVQHRFIELTFQQQYGLYESYGRITLLKEAWSIFRSYPIAGIGLNGYQQTTMTGLTYSHNLILQIAAEGGIVGLTIFAGAALWLVFQTHFHKGLEHNVMFFLGLYHLGASMFSGTYYDARWMWFFFVLFLLPTNAQHAVPPRALHMRDVIIPEQPHPKWLPVVK
jgi:O-antigen ligase